MGHQSLAISEHATCHRCCSLECALIVRAPTLIVSLYIQGPFAKPLRAVLRCAVLLPVDVCAPGYSHLCARALPAISGTHPAPELFANRVSVFFPCTKLPCAHRGGPGARRACDDYCRRLDTSNGVARQSSCLRCCWCVPVAESAVCLPSTMQCTCPTRYHHKRRCWVGCYGLCGLRIGSQVATPSSYACMISSLHTCHMFGWPSPFRVRMRPCILPVHYRKGDRYCTNKLRLLGMRPPSAHHWHLAVRAGQYNAVPCQQWSTCEKCRVRHESKSVDGQGADERVI